MLALAIAARALHAQSPRNAAAPIDSVHITRREAIAGALRRNPQLAAVRQQVAEARAAGVQLSAIPDLAATASLDQEPGLLHLGQAGAKNVGIGLQLPFPDKFRLLHRIGGAGITTARYTYDQARQLVAAQASEQYDSLLVALRHRDDLRASRALTADFLAKTQARFAAGTAARLDVIRAQVELAQADNALIASERAIEVARAGLDRVLGLPLDTRVVPADSLAIPPPLPPLDSIEAVALARRPEIGAVESEIAGARASSALAREFWLPDITLSATRDYAQPAPAMFSAGVAFPIPLLFWQHTRGEIAGDVARERELAATAVDVRAQVGQDVRAAYAAASTALRQAVYMRDQLLPAARAALRAALASYGLGGSSALEVIDARRTLVDAESQYADALAGANTARAELERAAGAPPSAFGTGGTP